MSYYRLLKRLESLKKWLKTDKVQVGILIAIFFQGGVLLWQTNTIRTHFKIQQRPIVGVLDVEPIVLGNRNLQSEIESEDEFIISVIFKNIGKSPAFVNYLKVKIFYGFFLGTKEKPCFRIGSMTGQGTKQSAILSEEVGVRNVEFFKDSILFPNQTTAYTTMVDAKKLMENIRFYTASREAPIYIECEVSYSPINKSKKYWYNCSYELQWPLAKRITIYSHINKSNAKPEPIHLTYFELLSAVAQRQKVKPVIDALTSGKDPKEFFKCDGVKL